MNDYAKELGKVLRSFDPKRMRKFIKKHRRLYSPMFVNLADIQDDQWVLGLMSKMIMNRTDMSDEDRKKAMAILDQNRWDYEI